MLTIGLPLCKAVAPIAHAFEAEGPAGVAFARGWYVLDQVSGEGAVEHALIQFTGALELTVDDHQGHHDHTNGEPNDAVCVAVTAEFAHVEHHQCAANQEQEANHAVEHGVDFVWWVSCGADELGSGHELTDVATEPDWNDEDVQCIERHRAENRCRIRHG